MVEAPAPLAVLPHRGSALWLEAVLELQPHRLLAVGRVPAGSPFARDGVCPAFAGLELCAQAAGYHAGVHGAETAAPRRGYLVGAQAIELLAGELPVAEPLQVAAERTGGAGALATYAVRVMAAARVLLQGTVSVYVEA